MLLTARLSALINDIARADLVLRLAHGLQNRASEGNFACSRKNNSLYLWISKIIRYLCPL